MWKRTTLLLVIIMTVFCGLPAYGANDAIVLNPTYEGLSGDAEFMRAPYRDYYYLDLREPSLIETPITVFNNLANMLFSTQEFIVLVSIAVIDACLNFDITQAFAPQLNGMVQNMKTSVFDELALLAIAFAGFSILKNFLWQNSVGVVTDILKTLLIIALSAALVTNTVGVITAVNDTTRTITQGILLKAVGGGGNAEFSKSTASLLWSLFVHKPYKFLEGDSVSDSQISSLLHLPQFSDDRRALVANMYASSGKKTFELSEGLRRIPIAFVVLIMVFIKCAILIFFSGLCFGIYLVTILFFLMSPMVLLFSMVPQFGGLNLVTGFFKKIVECQVAIFTLTFMMAVILKCDEAIYTPANIASYGWLVIMAIQLLLCTVIVLKYKEIINGMLGMMNARIPDLNGANAPPKQRSGMGQMLKMTGLATGNAALVKAGIAADVMGGNLTGAIGGGVLLSGMRQKMSDNRQRANFSQTGGSQDKSSGQDGSGSQKSSGKQQGENAGNQKRSENWQNRDNNSQERNSSSESDGRSADGQGKGTGKNEERYNARQEELRETLSAYKMPGGDSVQSAQGSPPPAAGGLRESVSATSSPTAAADPRSAGSSVAGPSSQPAPAGGLREAVSTVGSPMSAAASVIGSTVSAAPTLHSTAVGGLREAVSSVSSQIPEIPSSPGNFIPSSQGTAQQPTPVDGLREAVSSSASLTPEIVSAAGNFAPQVQGSSQQPAPMGGFRESVSTVSSPVSEMSRTVYENQVSSSVMDGSWNADSTSLVSEIVEMTNTRDAENYTMGTQHSAGPVAAKNSPKPKRPARQGSAYQIPKHNEKVEMPNIRNLFRGKNS